MTGPRALTVRRALQGVKPALRTLKRNKALKLKVLALLIYKLLTLADYKFSLCTAAPASVADDGNGFTESYGFCTACLGSRRIRSIFHLRAGSVFYD